MTARARQLAQSRNSPGGAEAIVFTHGPWSCANPPPSQQAQVLRILTGELTGATFARQIKATTAATSTTNPLTTATTQHCSNKSIRKAALSQQVGLITNRKDLRSPM
jgi:hypothetical protein